MKFTRTLAAGAALALLSTGAVAFGRVASTPQAAAAQQAMPQTQALADRYVSAGKAPGIVISAGKGDAPAGFVTAGKLGLEDGAAPVTKDSLWRVYSMTKPITAMAAMKLIEDGKMSLDQPVSDFIPGFKTMQVLDTPDSDSLASHPAKHAITIRMLLTHTSGLGYNIITKGALKSEYERQGILPGAINEQVEVQARKVRPTSLKDFADRVAKLPLVYEPGTKWSYSIGLDVMGRVIEVASGMPFDQYVQKTLLDPLKMHSTYWRVPKAQAGRLADNELWAGDNMIPIDPAATSVFLDAPSFFYGGGGLVSSASDYDRFLHMLQDGGELDGVRVLKADTVKLAMSNLLPAGVDKGALAQMAGGRDAMGFGAGGSVTLAAVPGGPGKGTYGWGGAAGTIAWVDPVNHIRVNAMVNYFPSDKWPLRDDVIKAVYADLNR